MKDIILESDSWEDFVKKTKYEKDWWYRALKCEIEEPVNEQEFSMLTGSFIPAFNQDEYVWGSHCFGTIDWTEALFPDPEVDVRNHDQEIYDEMIQEEKEEEKEYQEYKKENE